MKKQKVFSIASIVLLILLLGVVGYLTYDIVVLGKTVKKEEYTESTESIMDTNLDVNNSFVQTLYSYVKVHDYMEYSYFNMTDKKEITKDDFANDQKLYLGYRLVLDGDRVKDSCDNYQQLLPSEPGYFCGDSDQATMTVTIAEDQLKAKVEAIFGPGSYTAQTFNVGKYPARYVYLQQKGLYVLQSFFGGGSGPSVSQELVSVTKEDDVIVLSTHVTIGPMGESTEKTNETWQYTYKLSGNNYYFVKMAKVN